MNLSPIEVDQLVDDLRRQFLFQTATRIFKGVEIDRVNVAVQWPAYCRIMDMINRAGGFQPPKEHRQELLRMHAEKARTVGIGTYNLRDWSAGELSMAIDEAAGVEQLNDFSAACESEIKTRGN